MKATYGERWLNVAAAFLPENYVKHKSIQDVLRALLIVMWEQWNSIFKQTLGESERTLVSELRETRNKWAHSTTISTDDAYRALDSIARLLTAISAPQADEVERQKQELLRIRFEEQARNVTRRTTTAPTEGQPMAGLKPWREIATPHPDVASGCFQQAEFAADLWQVYLGEGSDEYRDPTEFYRRTYLTEGLKQLLANALRRLSGQGGDPVIELQTNFGGGKTHAMLALYHLCNARQACELPGMESVFQATGISQLPQNVNVAVLVGNKLQPSGIVPYKLEHNSQNRPVINTLWGELAWQLGGAEGYELVRRADETSTNPGDTLTQLFKRFSPCLILIDEWVAYARQLHEQSDLAGGSFDTQFTFAQTLSESAKNAKDTLLVVSIPSSDIEIGGERGKEALERLKNAIGRVESPWRPASAEESFEIVRRRLFQPMTDPSLFVQQDAVVKAFMDMYRSQSQEFPSECKETDYKDRLKAAYPIHPELFDRLYSDWSTLDKFQRTRGVLRLMARVIHYLAWKVIADEKEMLNLDAFQSKQADTKLQQYAQDVDKILRDTYQWLLIPEQTDAQAKVNWNETRLHGQDSPILQASCKACHEGDLLINYSATNLQLEVLDKYLWQDKVHIDLKQLWEYFTRYLYLPRLKDQSVLLNAIRDGVAKVDWENYFAYAEGFDETKGKYLKLQYGKSINPSISTQSLLVKPEVAQKQIDAENPPPQLKNVSDETRVSGSKSDNYSVNPPLIREPQKTIYRRFYGNVDIDVVRLNRDVDTIAKEVIQHLTSLNGATVKITLEIEAEIPDGVPDNIMFTVKENCQTLKFKNHSFDEE